MKIPFEPTPTINIHLMPLRTDCMEWVGDDNLWLVRAHIDNGDFNKEGKSKLQLKILDKSADLETLEHGGLVVFSNLKKPVIRKVLLSGIEYMMRTGQLTKDDFQDAPTAKEE